MEAGKVLKSLIARPFDYRNLNVCQGIYYNIIIIIYYIK